MYLALIGIWNNPPLGSLFVDSILPWFLSFFLDLGIASDYSEVGVTSLPSSCGLPSSVEASVPRRWLKSVVGSKKLHPQHSHKLNPIASNIYCLGH
jgi:hypothetical protein